MPISTNRVKPESNVAHLTIGKLGELLAAKWLEDRGYQIVDRHYLRKWGEIDVIAEKGGVVHFVEVKAVSYETKRKLEQYVPRETFKPEDRVHPQKLQRLRRVIETWIAEQKYPGTYQLDVVTVRMVPREKFAVVDLIENITFE